MTEKDSSRLPPDNRRSWALAPAPIERHKPQPATEGLELFETAPADESGYEVWKAEQEAAKRDFEKRWGIPLNKRVRVQIKGEPREREGLLRLAAAASPLASAGKLKLRLGDHVFTASEIESVTRV